MPLIIIPLCTFICVLLHVVCVCGACNGNNYECALPTSVLTESDLTVISMRDSEQTSTNPNVTCPLLHECVSTTTKPESLVSKSTFVAGDSF